MPRLWAFVALVCCSAVGIRGHSTEYRRLLSSIHEAQSKLGVENILPCNRTSTVGRAGKILYVPKMEFGYVALLKVPIAFRYCQNGMLQLLQICRGLYPLFYFVPRDLVVERNCEKDHVMASQEEMRQFHHNTSSHFNMPPYARVFKPPDGTNFLFLWNKFNFEWEGPPINFFNVDQLTSILHAARCFTERIYLRRANARSLATGETRKDASLVDMNELPRLRSGLATGIIQDDIDNNSLELMNVALLVLMSGANLAVGVQGGLATLSSIVGSHTLILCVKGSECPRSDSHFDFGWHPKLQNASIALAKTPQDVIAFLRWTCRQPSTVGVSSTLLQYNKR